MKTIRDELETLATKTGSPDDPRWEALANVLAPIAENYVDLEEELEEPDEEDDETPPTTGSSLFGFGLGMVSAGLVALIAFLWRARHEILNSISQ